MLPRWVRRFILVCLTVSPMYLLAPPQHRVASDQATRMMKITTIVDHGGHSIEQQQQVEQRLSSNETNSDPSHLLDFVACSALPAHLSCLVPAAPARKTTGENKGDCMLSYFAATQLSCNWKGNPSDVQNISSKIHTKSDDHHQPNHAIMRSNNSTTTLPQASLCPCNRKRTSLVSNVVITTKYRGGILRDLTAFTQLSRVINNNNNGLDDHHHHFSASSTTTSSWALVDASNIGYTSHICNKTLHPKYPASNIGYTSHICNKTLHPKYPARLHQQLEMYLRGDDIRSSPVIAPPRTETQNSEVAGTTGHFALPSKNQSIDQLEEPISLSRRVALLLPWTCQSLAANKNSISSALQYNSLNSSTAAHIDIPVFYAFEKFSCVAGHALELLLNGIGQYVTDGLDRQRVPWIVPCSDSWTDAASPVDTPNPPLVWTQFFLELNEGVGYPIVPVDIEMFLDVERRTKVLTFAKVYFATSNLSMNMFCFQPVIAKTLWPLAEAAARRRGLVAPCVNDTQACSSGARRGVGWLKMFRGNVTLSAPLAPSYSPQRTFMPSESFEAHLQRHAVHIMPSGGPLLERMWHVNTADLIVTTWGSTTTIVSLLLLPRLQLAALLAESSSARQLVPKTRRLLVFIHSSYCDEVSRLFPDLQCPSAASSRDRPSSKSRRKHASVQQLLPSQR
ncbi:Hypothetical protein, putative, partial [Bodo saltans]